MANVTVPYTSLEFNFLQEVQSEYVRLIVILFAFKKASWGKLTIYCLHKLAS